MSPDLHHLSGAYAVDALDDDERAAFEEHLASCADCRDEVAELTGAAHSVGVLTEAEPPPGLRSAVLDGVARVRPLPPPASGGEAAAEPGGGPGPRTGQSSGDRPAHPLLRRTSTWLAAAAAVILLAVGGLVWHPWAGQDRGLTAVEQVREAGDATTVTSTSGELTAKLAFSRGLDRSAITVTGLPPAPAGRAYELWYIGPQGARAAGFVVPGTDERGTALLAGPIDDATHVGLTVEPAGGSSAPTTTPLVVMALG